MSGSWPNNSLSTTSIINQCSDGGVTVGGGSGASIYASAITSNAKTVLSGALSAGTYKEMLSITGNGMLTFCAVSQVDETSRQVGLKIECNGVTAFDAYGAASTKAQSGVIGIGQVGSDGGCSQVCYFKNSLKIYIKSSLDETDKVQLHYSYELHT